MTLSTTLFAFESDFVGTLKCVPMAVRFKLDRCGIKLSLRQWSRLTVEDRRWLLVAPCDGASEIDDYRTGLQQRVLSRTGERAAPLPANASPGLNLDGCVPSRVSTYAASVGVMTIEGEKWSALTYLQKYALVKLSRDGHENENLLPALKEFGLARIDGGDGGTPNCRSI